MKALQSLQVCRSCLAQAARARAAGSLRLMPTRALEARPIRHDSLGVQVQSRTLSVTACRRDVGEQKELGEVVDDEVGGGMSEFRRQRLETLAEDRKSQDPVFKESYPRLKSQPNHMPIPKLRKIYMDPQTPGLDNTEVTVYGRVRAKRKHGNRLLFLDIVNEYERLQMMINFKQCLTTTPDLTLEKFRMFMRLIEVGDHISVSGKATRSTSGELTVQAHSLPELLSPALEQLPSVLKENRMQRRHVDLLVNQEAADILRLKSHITKFMRDHFHSRHFLEYQTPILAERAGGALARPFTTQSTVISSRELMMRVAPELWLKRLVIGGVDKVFEIGPVFRNEGIDADHNPEFTMCEFYSAYMNLEGLIKETEELMCGLAQHCAELIGTQLRSLTPPTIPFVRPFKQLEFVPALEEALGFRLPKLSGVYAYSELVAMLKMANVNILGDLPPTMPKLLDRLSAMYLEPVSMAEPVFITNYPSCMSPLAKSFVCKRTFQLVSARTELFVRGREIANMYEEENDPAEQTKKLRAHRELVANEAGAMTFSKNSPSLPRHERMTPAEEKAQEEAEARAQEEKEKAAAAAAAAAGSDGEVEPLDQSYVRAMRTGLPPTGGWGCGIERLVMMFSGANRISDCFSFGSLRNVLANSAEERAGDGLRIEDPIAKK